MKKVRSLWTLCIFPFILSLLAACSGPSETGWQEMEPVSHMELQYANQFAVEYYEDGLILITITDSGRYLVVPEDSEIPARLSQDITVIRRPPKHIYLAATSAMDLFRSLDAIDNIRLSGTDADGWAIPEAKQALQNGSMLYAGRYSTPDYELILSENCGLAIESTMIYHTPEVKEQLERLGIPVLVERSSYENSPIGRMEWIKLYGALLGKEAEAEAVFNRALNTLSPVLQQPATGKTVAFFYINSLGTVNVRRSGDYVSEMIRIAGGNYVPTDTGNNDNALSTMNMDQETFYASVKDADILVYNSAIDGELHTMDQLLQKIPLLADFKAVQSNHVFCTKQNMFQESMGLSQMVLDLHKILTTESDPQGLTYLYHLQ